MDLDSLFLSKILESNPEVFKKTLRKVPTELLQGIERKAYVWIKKYFSDSKGQMPSTIALKQKFPDVRLDKAKDAIHFYVDELYDRAKYEAYTKVISDIQNDLFAKNLSAVDAKYRKLSEKIAKLEMKEVVTAKSGLADRKRNYLEAKKNKGIIGYQVNIDAIDKRIGGIRSEYIVIAGKTGIGKTWLLVQIGKAIWYQIEAPLIVVSNEISQEEMYARFDSVIGEFNFSAYRKGQLTKEQEKKLASLGGIYDNLHDLYVINGAGMPVDEIEMLALSLGAGAILCDGIYLTDEGKNNQWDDTRTASRKYQQITKKHLIPVIGTNQLTNEGEVKYARALQEDADILMRMFQSQAMKTDKLMGIDFPKLRNEDNDLKAFLRWDFENWDFHEVDIEIPDRDLEKEYE